MKYNHKERLSKRIFLSNFRSIFGSIYSVVKSCSIIIYKFHMFKKHKGLYKTIEIFKEVERHTRMVFLNQPSKYNQKFWLSLDRLGFPKFLRLNPSLIMDPEYQRAVLTALGYYKLYSLSPDISVVNSISEPGPEISRLSLLDEIEYYAYLWLDNHNIKPFSISEDLPIYATTKAGANGSSAMGITSMADAKAVSESEVLPMIQSIIDKVYSPESVKLFWELFQNSLDQFETMSFKKDLVTARIHLLSEPGGKTRAICIPDIWTQTVLKPIHDKFMDVLKLLPHDGTFSHPQIAEDVKSKTIHHSLYCFDLTSATDRFPLEIQKRCLKPILEDLVDDWSNLISKRDFTIKGKQLRYAIGQPMGMLSSWAAFTISHHIFINYCLDSCADNYYAVIGDDMVIGDPVGAWKYRYYMDQLGVKISDEKSLYPYPGSKVGEIAKRYFRNGIDISPIPPKVLLESTKSVEGFLEFQEVLASRVGISDGVWNTTTGLDWPEILNKLWEHNLDKDSEPARALVTRPLFLPSFTGKEIRIPPLTGVGTYWDESMAKYILNLWDKFVLNESVTKLNESQVMLKSLGLPIKKSPGSTEIRLSPILKEYLSHKEKELIKYMRIYGGTYVGEEADSFEPTPQATLMKLLSEPDPFAPQDFVEKRKIRRKRSMQLIQKFWTKNKKLIQ